MIGDRIYERGKSLALELLKAPSEPPELPAGSHASVEVIRASPRFLAYRMVLLAIGAGIVFLALLVAIVGAAVAGQWWGIALAVLALVVVALFFIAHWFAIRVDYDLRYYVLTDRSLRVREGAWIVREKTLTYANVQNLARHQGPIQRLLGISDLRVEAAGGGGGGSEGKQGLWNEHGATIAGVENAAEIGETIRGYLRGRRDAGLGDPDDARRAPKGLGADAAALAELRLLAEEAQRLRAAAESRAARG